MTDIEGSLVFENSRTDVAEPIRIEDQDGNPPTSSSSTRIVVQPGGNYSSEIYQLGSRESHPRINIRVIAREQISI